MLLNLFLHDFRVTIAANHFQLFVAANHLWFSLALQQVVFWFFLALQPTILCFFCRHHSQSFSDFSFGVYLPRDPPSQPGSQARGAHMPTQENLGAEGNFCVFGKENSCVRKAGKEIFGGGVPPATPSPPPPRAEHPLSSDYLKIGVWHTFHAYSCHRILQIEARMFEEQNILVICVPSFFWL